MTSIKIFNLFLKKKGVYADYYMLAQFQPSGGPRSWIISSFCWPEHEFLKWSTIHEDWLKLIKDLEL